MKLVDFIEKNHSGNVSAFAVRIGERAQTVHRWVNGAAVPRPDTMALIYLATGGQVQPNDFYADQIATARKQLLATTAGRALMAGRG